MNDERQAGFSLVEVLAGLLILTLVITTSLAILFERERRLRRAEETVLVWQVMANEVEHLRHVPYGSLTPGTEHSFETDLALLGSFDRLETSVRIEQESPMAKKLSLRVTWGAEPRTAAVAIHRVDTGGGNLW